ncbi:MAG: two pore domain potassium channel family protein [Ruminiclostridium sp.]|jgi:voltage-gated potassium channel|nr:two pore domain potassium channel family protein [Ruminiclostridium sp.]
MKKLRILRMVLHKTKADRLVLGFVVFLLVVSGILWAVEPGMTTYREALWYCYAIISTSGFGDFVAVTFVGRVCSILVTIYAIFVIGIVTGVVVSYFQQTVQVQFEDSKMAFLDKLERLPELSKEELEEMAAKARKLR